jgi:hypothetical protein
MPELTKNERERFHALTKDQCLAVLFYALGAYGDVYPKMFREILEFAETHTARLKLISKDQE